MLNRKETRKVLVEWKNFLSEAKKVQDSSLTVRLFDFDGTIFRHPDPDYNDVLTNPFLAALLNVKILKKLVNQCKVPSELVGVLKDKSKNSMNYIISIVGTTRSTYTREDLVEKVRNPPLDKSGQQDKNFINLKKIAEDNGFGKALEQNDTEKLSNFFNFPSTEMSADNIGISNKHLMMAQEIKIDEFVSKNKTNIEKFYLKTNEAETEIKLDSEKVEKIPGSSGKGEIAQRIVKRIIIANPDRKFNFEIYDNKTNNIAEIAEAIVLADDYVPHVTYMAGEKSLFTELFGELQRSPHVDIKKFLATKTEEGVDFPDVSKEYFTRSKSRPADPASRLKRIKNLFKDLMTYYNMGGAKTGRPKEVNKEAVKKYFSEHNKKYLLEIWNDMYDYKDTNTKEFEKPENLYDLMTEMYEWLQDNNNFKDFINRNGAILSVGQEPESEEPSISPAAAKAEKRKAASKTRAQTAAGTQQPEEPVQPDNKGLNDKLRELDSELSAAIEQGDFDRADDLKSDIENVKFQLGLKENKLTESLNKLRLVLKKR